MPKLEAKDKEKKKFKDYQIGFVHIDIAEIKIDKKKFYLFVAIDRVSKFVVVRLYQNQTNNTISINKYRTSI